MTSILAISLLIRIAALGWSLVVWRRVKDWRIGVVALLIFLMALRQAFAIYGTPKIPFLSGVEGAAELPGLAVSVGILIVVVLIGRLVQSSQRATKDLLAANAQLRDQVAAREQAQHRLTENERVLSTLIENLPGMVYRCRNDKDWTMVFCSSGCRALTGYDPADFTSRGKITYAEIIHPDDQEPIWRDVQAALAESRPFQLHYRIRTASGGEKWVWEQGCLVSVDGEPYLEGFVTDITERKLVEDQLRHAQKMEVVGQLTGGVAHDFNNLLAIIMGNLELAAESAGPETSSREYIERSLAAAERGAVLTRQLLAFSRKQILRPQLVDLSKFVPRSAELLHRLLGEAIEIETVLAGGLWKTMVDPDQIEHALFNLAVNARDAMPSGGRLTIETANARLDDEYKELNRFAQPGPYVMLAVTDTGCGMPPEVAEHAFEPFFTTKEVGKGSGLGLSMVYGFVKQSGGHVKIYSEEGRGTTVKLYFPRAREQTVPVIERRLCTPAADKRTILVVEDDPDVRRLTKDALAEAGYRVIEAADGPAALAILKDGAAIDLLFTDLVLPGGIDGIALAEQARALRPNLKIIYTTGYGYSAAQRNNGFDERADVLVKPYRKSDLIQRIGKTLGNGCGKAD